MWNAYLFGIGAVQKPQRSGMDVTLKLYMVGSMQWDECNAEAT